MSFIFLKVYKIIRVFYNNDGSILYATNSDPSQNEPIQVEKVFVNNHYSIVSDTVTFTENHQCLTNPKIQIGFIEKILLI